MHCTTLVHAPQVPNVIMYDAPGAGGDDELHMAIVVWFLKSVVQVQTLSSQSRRCVDHSESWRFTCTVPPPLVHLPALKVKGKVREQRSFSCWKHLQRWNLPHIDAIRIGKFWR